MYAVPAGFNRKMLYYSLHDRSTFQIKSKLLEPINSTQYKPTLAGLLSGIAACTS
jgi:hypothetical protein